MSASNKIKPETVPREELPKHLRKASLPDNFSFDQLDPEPDSEALQHEPPVAAAPDIAAMAASAQIDYSKRIEKPPLALTIDGEMFGTLGDFSVLKGKAKSRKSFASTLFMAAALGKQVGRIKGHLPPDKNRVVLFDTEQSEYHVNAMANRVTKLYGAAGTVEHFAVYSLREQGTANRLAIIEHVLATTPDIGLAIIDGARDIVKSINDEEEATATADRLLRWTTIYKCHIITVLHMNKGNDHLRGHIGTELQNKAQTVVSVERDKTNKEVTLLSASEARDKEFEQFAFMVTGDPGELALPEIIDYTPPDPEKSRSGSTAPEELTGDKHAEIIRHAKHHCEEKPNRSEVKEQVKAAYRFTMKSGTFGDTKAREWLTYYLNHGYIVRHGKERSPTGYFSFRPVPDKFE